MQNAHLSRRHKIDLEIKRMAVAEKNRGRIEVDQLGQAVQFYGDLFVDELELVESGVANVPAVAGVRPSTGPVSRP